MSNVLNAEKQQQIIVLGQLGWFLRRIEQQTAVRRETASAYLKAAGIAVRGPGRWRRGTRPPTHVPPTDSTAAKPANEVITDSGEKTPEKPPPQSSNPSPSACEPYRETIESWFDRGRNAMAIWQDLLDQHAMAAAIKRSTVSCVNCAALTPLQRWHHSDCTRRRSPGRLRHRSHGARREERQVP